MAENETHTGTLISDLTAAVEQLEFSRLSTPRVSPDPYATLVGAPEAESDMERDRR